MERYIVDFSGIQRYFQLHEALKRDLQFPDYYGENLDALWDCLTDFMGESIHIELRGTQGLTGIAKDEMEGILRIFEKAAKKMDTFHYEVVS